MEPGLPPLEYTPAPWSYNPPPRIPPVVASLDSGLQNCTCARPYCVSCKRQREARDRRRKRCFQRSMSGLAVGGNMKLLTLTTSEESWEAGKDIHRSFRALVMRLRRRKLISGYLRVVEYTKAGLPHLHVIVRGPYLAQWWMSQMWQEIHLSRIVDIRAVGRKSGAAAYLSKYLGKDSSSRYSWSWDWVWRGFVKSWRWQVRNGLSAGYSMLDIIDIWEFILREYGRRRAVDG